MLTKDELIEIETRLNRKPNHTEKSVFDAMWSEHCSYKTSKSHLKRLYTNNRYVYSEPGENAGVISIGGTDRIAFKMESHNHPSYIEPFQGAATGVGGILRDILQWDLDQLHSQTIYSLETLPFLMIVNVS